MIKKVCIIIAIILAFMLGRVIIISCIKIAVDNEESTAVQVDKKYNKEIKSRLKKMTIDEKIGQLIIAGFDGTTVNDELQSLILEKYIGGVILFSKNVESASQVVALNNEIKEINKVNKSPIFISVDEEGGLVSRMPSEFKDIPTNSDIAKYDDEDLSYNIGKVIGEEISSLGFNMDFAPVLDINSNPDNPVIGNRSFGDNEAIVSKLGIATMKGLKDSNIIATVKHFPGHGDTSVDSHVGLPVVENDLERLKSFELVPFQKAIDEGVDMVMVSHIMLPKIDENDPATLSKTIVTDILRKDMNYNGVVVTDDMTMGAIINNYDIGEAAVKSINAGVDIVMVCHQYENVTKVIDAIKEAVNNGSITEERIDKSVERILKLKDKYNIEDGVTTEPNVDSINDKISSVLEKIK